MLDFSGGYEYPTEERYVPVHLRGGLENWIRYGIEPGGFLYAVLTNDLRGAMNRGDETSRKYLFGIVSWLWNRAPAACWGSPETVELWASEAPRRRIAATARQG